MQEKSKLIVRFTIVYMIIYFIYAFYNAIISNINVFNDLYILLLELCLYLFINQQGKYHCKYIRWSALGIFLSDSLTRLETNFDILPDNGFAYLPAILLVGFVSISIILALHHFIRVTIIKIKRQ